MKAMVMGSTWTKFGAFVRRVPILPKSGPKLTTRKAAGGDDISIELLKSEGCESVKVLSSMCNYCEWKKKRKPLLFSK